MLLFGGAVSGVNPFGYSICLVGLNFNILNVKTSFVLWYRRRGNCRERCRPGVVDVVDAVFRSKQKLAAKSTSRQRDRNARTRRL